MNLKDKLTQVFKDHSDYPRDFMHGDMWVTVNWGDDKGELTSLGKVFFEYGLTFSGVDHYGGEDMGSTYYNIVLFKSGAEMQAVKFYGYYQSFNGTDYEGWRFVEAREKTITEWV